MDQLPRNPQTSDIFICVCIFQKRRPIAFLFTWKESVTPKISRTIFYSIKKIQPRFYSLFPPLCGRILNIYSEFNTSLQNLWWSEWRQKNNFRCGFKALTLVSSTLFVIKNKALGKVSKSQAQNKCFAVRDSTKACFKIGISNLCIHCPSK